MKLDLQHGSRSHILAALIFIIMAVFVVRLFYLQVIRHDHYTALARQEHVKRLVIPAQRGEVYMMDGGQPVRVVMNETVYTLFVDPQVVTEPKKVERIVREVAGGHARSALSDLIQKEDSRYQILATKLSPARAEMIKSHKLNGVGFQKMSQRVYPEGSLASQTIGFVNSENVGQYGIEGYLNERFQGTDGLLQSVTDVSNVPLTIGDNNINQPAKKGEDIVLSLDRNVQKRAETALVDGLDRTGAQKGSVIVMDPQSGRILAMANMPSYSPAEYAEVTDVADFSNPVVSVPYEAGSAIKAFTVAAALDKGTITPESMFNNTDRVQIEDRTITNATKGRTGQITMQTALDYSLNTGMVEIAKRLGKGSIDRTARTTMYQYFYEKFGLGQPTGVEVSGEARGSVISPDETEGNAVRYSNMSFGQGMDVTMVQVAAALGSIVNGGTFYQPSVIEGLYENGTLKPNSPADTRKTISKKASDDIRKMMSSGREQFYGSLDRSGFEIGGKTGTSQTIRDGVYTDDETVATYLGYGGDDAPKYVIMVQVSGRNMNLQGGRDAAPIFTDISNWMIDYLRLQPRN